MLLAHVLWLRDAGHTMQQKIMHVGTVQGCRKAACVGSTQEDMTGILSVPSCSLCYCLAYLTVGSASSVCPRM